MTLAKRLSISFASIATAITVGALGSAPAQAITINGQVTGTWDYSYGDGDNVNVGDTFTADYSYDDATLTFFDNSQPEYHAFGYYGPLLSLIVNSGSYSHTFDFSNGYSQVSFTDLTGDPSTFDYNYKYFSVFGYENTAPGSKVFSAVKEAGESGGEPFNYLDAILFVDETNTGNPSVDAFTNSNVQFTPDPIAVPTAVPEPSLLAGLLGLGVGVMRKRKAEAAKQTSEV